MRAAGAFPIGSSPAADAPVVQSSPPGRPIEDEVNALIPKSTIIRDRRYLDSLRAGPCIVTGSYECEPAHLRLLGSGGMGIKPSDSRALPMRWDLHRRQSQEGEGAVWLWCANEYPDFLFRLLIEVAEGRHEKWRGR